MITISQNGDFTLIADRNANTIRKLIISTTEVSLLAGSSAGSANGFETNAQFNSPTGISLSPDGSSALVSDYNTDIIRQIIISTGLVTTIAGLTSIPGSIDGISTNARFFNTFGCQISPNGYFALVADFNNNLIRYISLIDDPTIIPAQFPTSIPQYFHHLFLLQ